MQSKMHSPLKNRSMINPVTITQPTTVTATATMKTTLPTNNRNNIYKLSGYTTIHKSYIQA